jgi:hypothetical protein
MEMAALTMKLLKFELPQLTGEDEGDHLELLVVMFVASSSIGYCSNQENEIAWP